MGEFPARIVAEDFVTPPEFAGLKLAGEGSGRIGGARFSLLDRKGVSHLANVYEQVPIRVLSLDFGVTEPVLVYLLNPTAGLMDGDAHRIEIDVGRNTRAIVTGQSATRIHPCLNGFSTQQWRITVADGATLVVLPGPAIPFAGSRYYQRVQIDLAPSSCIIWGDIWFAGRYARKEMSEWFKFDRMIQEMCVRRDGQLIYRDRFHWRGPWNDQVARWHFGGHPAAGSVFASHPSSADSVNFNSDETAARLATAAGDSVWRFTGRAEQVVHGIVRKCLSLARAVDAGLESSPWLIGSHAIGRTHWFE